MSDEMERQVLFIPHPSSFNMPNPLQHVDSLMLGDLYTSREVMDNLEVLCDDFGSRWAGSQGERQAADFFLHKFREYGLAGVRAEPFEYVGWVRGRSTLRVVAPVDSDIPCFSLPMCGTAIVEGGLVYVGDGSPGEFEAEAERLRGGIAMVCSQPPRGLNRTVHRSEKYQRSAVAGAKAFLYMNQYPGYGPETGSIANDREALIPGVAVSYEDGQHLLRLQRRCGPLTLRIETTDTCPHMTSWNVVGELPGRTKPDEWVLVGCHYDGHDIAQGAHDPASGAVSVVEAARLLAKHAAGELGCGLRFVLFGVEETGLIGAYRYVERHAAELDQIRFMLNLDAAGGSGAKGLYVNRWPELEPALRRWEAEMAAELPVAQKTSGYSDHYPFFLAGVPTAMMGDPNHVNTGRGFDHTAYDTLDKVHIGDLRDASAAAARLALRLSREEPWPLQRRTKEEVAEIQASEPSLDWRSVRDAMEALYAGRGLGARASTPA